MTKLTEEVYVCIRCEETKLPFVKCRDVGRAFRFPPTIGASGAAALLFVGINPRVSDSNRDLHYSLMQDLSSFAELAGNRHRGYPYIGQQGLERHYSVHARIANRLFPGEPFEAFAVATELFFCASANSRGLRAGRSPCADHYFERVLAVVKPKVVFAVGRPVEAYMAQRYGRVGEKIFATWQDVRRAPVIGIPHPNSRGEKISKWNQAAETARVWLSEKNSPS